MRKLINRLLLRFYKPNQFTMHCSDGEVQFVIWGPYSAITNFEYKVRNEGEYVKDNGLIDIDLKIQLRRALAAEDYEQAAKIRDKMKEV